MLDFVFVQLLQIKEALEEGQNTRADQVVFKIVGIAHKQPNENSSDEHDV